MEYSFEIKRIRLTEAHFSIVPQFKNPKEKPIEIISNVNVKYDKVENGIHVVVSISSDSDKQPFRFSVSWEGLFTFAKMPADKEIDRIAQINCAAIIFPYARESVADLTRRANMPPLNLSPFNFVAMYDEKKKSVSKTASLKARKRSKTRP
ncbi:MAG: protein-export chaperone SecB [Deltaproteobacteria bacterium]|nr:protein-export chaperone SecB [Deltaproteobacteria bacterium]